MTVEITESDLLEELRGKLSSNYRQAAMARDIGVSIQFANQVLKGHVPMTPKVYSYLGYERVIETRFVKKI